MAEVKSIQQRVLEIVAQEAGVSVGQLDLSKALEDNGLEDSLTRMEFVMALEETFRITINDKDAKNLDKLRLQEWIQYVEAARGSA